MWAYRTEVFVIHHDRHLSGMTPDINAMLARHGKDGWELASSVQVTRKDYDEVMLIFRKSTNA